LCGEKHRYRTVISEDFPYEEEQRWWTISGGPAAATYAFQTIASGAARAVGFEPLTGWSIWQWWLDFLQENGIGMIGASASEVGRIDDICDASRRACILLATGTLDPPEFLSKDATGRVKPPSSRVVASATTEPQSRERLKAARRTLVEEFIKQAWDEENTIVKKRDIWGAAAYKTRTEFGRWQGAFPEPAYGPGGNVDKRFQDILAMRPRDFVRRMKKRRSGEEHD